MLPKLTNFLRRVNGEVPNRDLSICSNVGTEARLFDHLVGKGKFLGWLVKEKKITPHITVWEKSDREDGIFKRSHFGWDKRRGHYICPNGSDGRFWRGSQCCAETGRPSATPRRRRASSIRLRCPATTGLRGGMPFLHPSIE